MVKSSSLDFRVRIVGDIERVPSCRSAPRRFGVAASTAVRLNGSGRLAAHVAMLIGWVQAKGDIIMRGLAVRLLAEKAVTPHPASLSRLLRVHGSRVKKIAAGERNRSR